ncbi:MAG: type secretion system protein TrbI [Bryobacterales bacterium]|nr:type secretion system protein TrbI [Bryobacterales bacterium]
MNEKAEAASTNMNAPSGLDLNSRAPRSVRVSKRAAGVVMAIVAVVLGLFAYGGYKRQQRQVATLAERNQPREVAPATVAGSEIAKEVPSGNLPNMPPQSGVLQPPGELPPATATQPQGGGPVYVRQAPVQVQPEAAPVPPRQPSPEERTLIAAYEREQQAITAPMTVRDGFGSQSRSSIDDNSQIANVVQALTGRNAGTTPPAQPGGTRSVNQDVGEESGMEAFLAKARAGQPDDYLKSTRTAPLSPYEIKAGWEIPAVLEQALNSELPGETKALVASDVYDTASGRHLLIPQGARLVGVYNSRIGYGQDGLQVIWNRVIYPDGSSLDLSGMIGQDAHGFSGFRDKVDRHYTRLVGFAVLTSLFSAASQISQNQNRSVLTYPSPGQVAGSAVGQQASELGAQITSRNLNVHPTIKISAGYRFNVRVHRDMLFDAPYTTGKAWRE